VVVLMLLRARGIEEGKMLQRWKWTSRTVVLMDDDVTLLSAPTLTSSLVGVAPAEDEEELLLSTL
jgi:hypothetical protein